MALFKALSGNRANLPEEKHDGYVYFCEDDGSFHVDYKDAAGVLQREQINAKDAETLCGMTLDEIKTHVTVQPDWAQNDERAADYIKNKPNVVTEEVFNEEINKRPIAYPAVIEDGVIIEPGKKIDASLIDAEWLATSIKADLDITISNKNADSFEVIEVLGVPMMTKLSDTVPTLEQLKSSIITTTASDGASQEIKITTDMIVQDPELIGNAYIVYDMLLICDKEVTDPDMGVTLNKGIYLGETIPGALEHFGATSINLYIPDSLSSINFLPEKYLPDTIARVSDVHEETSAKVNELKASGGIGHVENKLVEIFGEMETNSDGEYVATAIPKEGDEVTFYIDGVAYVRTAKIGVLGDHNAVYIGNGAEFGLPTTDDDFCLCMVDAGMGIAFYTIFADDGTHTVSCYAKTETIYTIDPKFLPSGGGISIYTLKTLIKGNTAAQLLCEEDCAFLDKQAEKKEGFVCNWTEDHSHEADPTLTGFMSSFLIYNGVSSQGELAHMFALTIGTQMLKVGKLGDGWIVSYETLEG